MTFEFKVSCPVEATRHPQLQGTGHCLKEFTPESGIESLEILTPSLSLLSDPGLAGKGGYILCLTPLPLAIPEGSLKYRTHCWGCR